MLLPTIACDIRSAPPARKAFANDVDWLNLHLAARATRIARPCRVRAMRNNATLALRQPRLGRSTALRALQRSLLGSSPAQVASERRGRHCWVTAPRKIGAI